jgi:ribosomal-protein-alanine N-acetyltransferase
MTIAQSLSWPTEPVAYGPVVLRAFWAADLPMVQEMSTDPYVPLIGTLPPNSSAQAGGATLHRPPAWPPA